MLISMIVVNILRSYNYLFIVSALCNILLSILYVELKQIIVESCNTKDYTRAA